jgi:peptidoglycan lytic transglycosylase G
MARTMTRRHLPWLVIGTLCLVALAGSFIMVWLTSPVASVSEPSPRLVAIPEGATFRQVAALLEQHHVIRSRLGFTLLGKLTSADRRIIPGEYALDPAMRPREILAKLLGGQIVLYAITIPEGYTVAQVAAVLDEKGVVDGKEFLALTHDREFNLAAFRLDRENLEGYLFPDTYHFPRNAKTKDVVMAMVEGLWRIFTPEWRARAQEIHLSVHEVLTLASVIEKETGAESERELISSVFHNRLRRRIPLQSDPTVIYGLSAFDGNLKKRDLERTTPYNTYRVAGLPPGPIANPGARAIRAALYPAPTTYLYFVSKNNGTHQFSSTLMEHNQAVERYQRRRPEPQKRDGPTRLHAPTAGTGA